MVPKIRFTFTTHAFGARGCAHPHPGGRARRARRVRAPPPRAGRRAPNANPPLLPPSNPSHRARAPPRARGSLPSVQVCPSSRTSRRPILISLPLKCVLASIRPLPDPTLASCPSRPRTPFVIPACQQPAHRVRATPRPHACAPLPIAPPSLETAPQYSGRAAAARNRAAGSTPAARTPPHTRVAEAHGVSFPPRRPSPNLGLRLSLSLIRLESG